MIYGIHNAYGTVSMESLAYKYKDFWCRISIFNGFSSREYSAKDCCSVHWQHYNLFPTIEQHHEDVDCVLERLSVANLKVNVNKCAFSYKVKVVLGFIVFKDEINPNPAKLQVIKDLKPQKNLSGIKQILVIFNFYRSLSQNLLR